MLDSTFGGSYGVRIPDLPMLLKTTWVRTTSKQVKDAGGLKSLSSNRHTNRWVGKPNLQSVLALTGSCVAEPHACGQQRAVELLKPCTKGTCTQPAGENNEASLEQFEKDA